MRKIIVKYILAAFILVTSQLYSYDCNRVNETETTWWLDCTGRIFVDLDGHVYELTPLKHSETCGCFLFQKYKDEFSG